MSKPFLMTYQSSFPFESSHFNGPDQYARMGELVNAVLRAGPEYPITSGMLLQAFDVMEGTHGHNFRADIFVGLVNLASSGYASPVSYLIDDVALAAIVARYNRRNLSVSDGLKLLGAWAVGHSNPHPSIIKASFARRATTENLAKDMMFEVLALLKEHWVNAHALSYAGDICCRVTIHETDSISASAEEWLRNVKPKGV